MQQEFFLLTVLTNYLLVAFDIVAQNIFTAKSRLTILQTDLDLKKKNFLITSAKVHL